MDAGPAPHMRSGGASVSTQETRRCHFLAACPLILISMGTAEKRLRLPPSPSIQKRPILLRRSHVTKTDISAWRVHRTARGCGSEWPLAGMPGLGFPRYRNLVRIPLKDISIYFALFMLGKNAPEIFLPGRAAALKSPSDSS